MRGLSDSRMGREAIRAGSATSVRGSAAASSLTRAVSLRASTAAGGVAYSA